MESVWDYPRPPRIESTPKHIVIRFGGAIIGDYFDVVSGDARADGAAWGYADPTPAFVDLRGRVAFYARPMESCTVDGEIVLPQPGGFYGGWITKDLVGPFKGEPGSRGW